MIEPLGAGRRHAAGADDFMILCPLLVRQHLEGVAHQDIYKAMRQNGAMQMIGLPARFRENPACPQSAQPNRQTLRQTGRYCA